MDNLKNRRRLAWFSAFYSLVIWPNLLIAYNIYGSLNDGIINNMLLYVGTLASGPIGAYIWAANKKDNNENTIKQPQ